MKNILLVTTIALSLVGCGGGTTDSANQPWYGDGGNKPNTAPKIQIASNQISSVFGELSETEFTVVDAENNPISISKISGPSWAVVESSSSAAVKIKAVPDEIGVFNLSIQVSDGTLKTPLDIVISVKSPDVLSVSVPAGDFLANGDKVTIRAANSDTEFSVGAYIEEKKEFSFEIPIGNDEFKHSDLILKSERAGFAPLSSWFGRGDALINSLGSKLILPQHLIDKMVPTPESSAILHAMAQYGALGKDAEIANWSSISSRAIDARYLEQLVITYAMSREIPELFVLNSVLIADIKRSYDKPLKETRLSQEITDARLKVESLVSEQYWQVLNERFRTKLFSTSKTWGSGSWVVSHPSGLYNSSSYGFTLNIEKDNGCVVGGLPGNCSVDEYGLTISKMPIMTTWVPSDVLRDRLISRGLSLSAVKDIYKDVVNKKLNGVNVSEMYTSTQLRVSAKTYDQRHILNATISGAMLIHELSRGAELNFQAPMIAQPLVLKNPRHWIFKPEIFDMIAPMPNASLQIDSTVSWLDLFNADAVQELDAGKTLNDGVLQWSPLGWSVEPNQPTNTVIFKKDDFKYSLTIFDESSPHYDHLGDVHGRQYGAVASLTKGGNVEWEKVVPVVLYPKARCELSPLSKNICDQSAFVEFSKHKGWFDTDTGRAPLTESQFDKKRFSVAGKDDKVELSYFDDSGCGPGVEIEKCQNLLASWQVLSSKEQPGLWALLSSNGDPEQSAGYRIIKLNNGDLIYYDLKEKRIKHFRVQ